MPLSKLATLISKPELRRPLSHLDLVRVERHAEKGALVGQRGQRHVAKGGAARRREERDRELQTRARNFSDSRGVGDRVAGVLDHGGDV